MLCSYCATGNPSDAAVCHNCGAALHAPHLPIGTVLHDQYRIEKVLGQGGFGITYLAFDIMLEHHVAIKELFVQGSSRAGNDVRAPYNLQPSDYQRTKDLFLEEARVAQRFRHDNICKVYGVFEQHQTAYMVMEAMQGETLASKINRFGRLNESDVRAITDQLGAALQVIHAAGILHRDIKPDNIFITNDQRVVLLDFGSARAFVRGRATKHTKLVTPGYAAPEQYSSEAKFGEYTDVYGLAATVFHAIEGHMPPTAPDRMLGKTLEFKSANETWKYALQKGLELRVTSRSSTVNDFIESTQSLGFGVIADSNLLLGNAGLASQKMLTQATPQASLPAFYPLPNWKVTDNAFYYLNTEFRFKDLKEVAIVPAQPDWTVDFFKISITKVDFAEVFTTWFAALLFSVALFSILGVFVKGITSTWVLILSLLLPTVISIVYMSGKNTVSKSFYLLLYHHNNPSTALDPSLYNMTNEDVVLLAETIAKVKNVPLSYA
jgi:serine/threonine protein kinase